MAVYSSATAVHKTLTPNVADTVNLTAPVRGFQVINKTGSAELYFTHGHLGATPVVAATVMGNDTHSIPAIAGASVEIVLSSATGVAVSIISSGAMAYDVQSIDA